jgi:hypothetical protein
MEQVPRAKVPRREEAAGNVVLKAEAPHRRIRAVWEPAEVKAGDQAVAPAGVRAEAEVPDRDKVGGLKKSTI